MRVSLLLSLAALTALTSFGQQSARQLTRRIEPLLPPPPARAQPGHGGVAAGAAAGAAVAADPAKVAAEKKKSESDVIKYYRQRAEGGSDNAQYELGIRYLTGSGIEKDEKLGREWIEKSAKAGNPKAVRKLEELGPVPQPETKEVKETAPAAPQK